MASRSLSVCGTAAVVGVAGAGVANLAGALYAWLTGKDTGSHEESPYEMEKVVHEYMGFHYAPPYEYVTYPSAPKDALDFPNRCFAACKKHKNDVIASRALDVGCAVGRSTFELASIFEEVIGIDYSRALIAKAKELKFAGRASYNLVIEGDCATEMEAVVNPDVDRSRVQFRVGDACSLPDDIGQFGLVLAANLICRLQKPLEFLNRTKDLVLPSGIMILTTPFTWMETYTPKRNWLGGCEKDGRRVKSFDVLREVLSPHFILLEELDMPFLIRETVRKHQWTVAHMSVWMRKI